MRLLRLLQGLPAHVIHGDEDREVTGLADRADRVKPGAVFVARNGSTTAGRQFIGQALARGATAVVGEIDQKDVVTAAEVTWIRIAPTDRAWVGRLAQRWFGEPARKLRLVGITGTNGKTTTAWVVRHLLAHAGCRCGMLGTVMNHDGADSVPAQLTTPGPIEIAAWLATMVDRGCEAAVLEVSSHALDQGRVDALSFDAAVFTNLTGDHLDYHGTMEAYGAAKARLFDLLKPNGTAVVNIDDGALAELLGPFNGDRVRCRFGTETSDPHAATAEVMSSDVAGTTACFRGAWGTWQVHVPLPGRHNVCNALLATTVAHRIAPVRLDPVHALADLPPVPGRLERVMAPEIAPTAPVVMVDYAHTHDALENVLRTVRPLAEGRVIVVFGCGGDRDASKRPKMAEVACRLADRVVMTNDNPRHEDPAAILRDMRRGIPRGEHGCVVERADRREAIVEAIAEAHASDVVVIAGKGHEDYQIIGDERHGFDDRCVAASALRAHVERLGPAR